MKKRIFVILLSALLAANVTACNYALNDNIQEKVSESTTDETSNKEDLYIDDAQNTTVENEENSQASENSKKITLKMYSELVGCHVITESSENLKQLMSKDEARIKVKHEAQGSNIFHITTLRENTEHKTTISLSEGVRVPEIYCGFTSEQNGYVMIFHLEGYSVSPMDDIELACILRTADGGKTWNKTEYNDFRVSNSREYISAACFFTEDVGFFTARYANTDHFGPRTYWTVDGGKTWDRMPRLDIPNLLQPFGIRDDFSSEISDVTVVSGVYTLTVRICHGCSIELDGETDSNIYIQYSSEDLINWTLVK